MPHPYDATDSCLSTLVELLEEQAHAVGNTDLSQAMKLYELAWKVAHDRDSVSLLQLVRSPITLSSTAPPSRAACLLARPRSHTELATAA